MKAKTKKAKDLQPGDVLSVEPFAAIGEVQPMEGGGVWYSVKGGSDGEGPEFVEANDDDDVMVFIE